MWDIGVLYRGWMGSGEFSVRVRILGPECVRAWAGLGIPDFASQSYICSCVLPMVTLLSICEESSEFGHCLTVMIYIAVARYLC